MTALNHASFSALESDNDKAIVINDMDGKDTRCTSTRIYVKSAWTASLYVRWAQS
jgi:hypothetical protein